MANIVFNIAKGRFVELYNRVKANDPAASALVVVPIETAGLETDAVLKDADTLAAVLAGTTNEQVTMGRKVLTDADLAAAVVDDVNDKFAVSIPQITWAAAAGNPISKLLIGYDSDSGAGTDAGIVPLVLLDFTVTPTGTDVIAQTGAFGEAA